MNKNFFYLAVFACFPLWANAQVIDLLSEDDIVSYDEDAEKSDEAKAKADEDSEKSFLNDESSAEDMEKEEVAETEDQTENAEEENKENAEGEKKSGFFSFITKPMSLMFSSADEKVEDGKTKETYLEKNLKQADEGKTEAQLNLAYMYLYGYNGVEQDLEKAVKYYNMAAEQNDPVALNNLGSLYFNGIGVEKDQLKALDYFQKAAQNGNDSAATNLAFIYLSGGKKSVKRNEKAIELLEKAVEKDNPVAKFMLGYAYYKGFVVEQDYEKAFELIEPETKPKVAFDEAQYILGKMYLNGAGTVQNYALATKTFREAFAQGNLKATMELARIYSSGEYAKIDRVEAHALLNFAASKGVKGAKEMRETLVKKMKLEEIMAAQAQAQNIQVKPSEETQYVRQTYGNNITAYIDMNIVSQEDLAKRAKDAHKNKSNDK